jgi:predicted CoA-binding protein
MVLPMGELENAVKEFLSQERIAVAGVSRSSNEPANLIFRKLRDSGHRVYPVNPKASAVEGVTCYPGLDSLPAPVDALVVATPPSAAPALVERCAALGIRWVWMHRSLGTGSVSREAVNVCRDHGIRVIPGACPMMFCEPVDVAHKCMRWIVKLTRRLPVPD